MYVSGRLSRVLRTPGSDGAEAYRLSGPFWTDFVRDVWGTTAAKLSLTPTHSVMTEAEALRALRAASDDVRNVRRDVQMSLFVDDGPYVGSRNGLLPDVNDESLTAYNRRIRSRIGERDYTLALYSVHLYFPALYHRSRAFLSDLFRITGVPQGAVDTDIWLGQYSKNPSGIHRDAAANFSFILSGNKRYIFWPRSRFDSTKVARRGHVPLGRDDYEALLEDSVVVEASPGDVVYWPADHWHMAISDPGEFTCTLNIAMYHNRDPKQFLVQSLGNILQDDDTTNAAPCLPVTGSRDMPDAVTNAFEELRDIVDSGKLWEQAKRRWLRFATASGFERIPDMSASDVELNDDDCVRTTSSPILCLPSTEGRYYVSAAGQVAEIAASHHLESLLVDLNTGSSIAVSLLRTRYGDAERAVFGEDGYLDALLQFLIQAGGLEVDVCS